MSEPRSEVALITRVRTLNKGNQALSAAWLELLRRAFPDASIRLLERRPPHLLQHTLARLARARDPWRAFDALTTRLAKLAPGADRAGRMDPDPRILLDETIAPPARFPELRRRLNLRGWLARAGRYRAAYLARLAALQRARFVVLNPAGEFFPRMPEPAFYYLLEAHVAHKLGRPVAIVNHTMDIEDPTLRALIPPLYRELELIGFRDGKSIDAFRAMGGDPRNVFVSPDLALLSRVAASDGTRRRATAIAINVPEATARGYAEQWIEVLRRLRAQGDLVLVSNELPADHPFYERLVRELGLTVEGEGLDYDRYAALLGTFDVVISSRMHTAILAMLGGAPVVPVEGSSFKITGLFQELGLAIPVIHPSSQGWIDDVVARAAALRDRRDSAATEIASKVTGARERILELLVPRLQAAGG